MNEILILFIAIIGLLILGACFMHLFLYNKEIKRINEQIKFLIDNESNANITLDYSNNNMSNMVNNINNLINKYRTLQVEAGKKEKNVKDDFVNLSHDIRTPLTAISGYFQMLKNTEDVNEKEKYTKIIDERIKSLQAILESIFTYSKLQNDCYELSKTEFDINKLVTDVTLSFYENIKKNNMTPTISYLEEAVMVMGNEEAYKRLLQNLLLNAIEHGTGEIILSLNIEENMVHFCCKNSIGFDNDIDIERVFDRLYKADKNRTHTSSGLGLSIVKMIADKMNAVIKASINDEHMFVIDLYTVLK